MLLFFNLSGGEIFVIILVTLIVFGPGKIPEIARQIGRAINEMKKASNDIAREIRRETSVIENNVSQEIHKVKAGIESAKPDINMEIPDVYTNNVASENKSDQTTENSTQ